MVVDPDLQRAGARQARASAQAKGAPENRGKGKEPEGVGDDGATSTQTPNQGTVPPTPEEGPTRVGPIPARQRPQKPRVLLKIIVLGCSNVGKTSLMKRYVANDFTGLRRPTIGADFMTKEIVVGDQPMLLQIWDTAGQERFHKEALGPGFFRGANAALLVYDVASAKSFEQVAMWREELLVKVDVDPYDFPIVVVGNKVDLEGGVLMDGVHGVDKAVVHKWTTMQGMGHIETSAKDGTGVEVAMEAVAGLALEQKIRRDAVLAANPNKHNSRGAGKVDLTRRGSMDDMKANGCCGG